MLYYSFFFCLSGVLFVMIGMLGVGIEVCNMIKSNYFIWFCENVKIIRVWGVM